MLRKSGCLRSQTAGAGFVRNHYKPDATTTKLRLHSYSVDRSVPSVILRPEQKNVSDRVHVGGRFYSDKYCRLKGVTS